MTALSYQYPKGRITIHGYFWSADLLDDAKKRLVILQYWRSKNSTLYQSDLGYFLLYKTPMVELVGDLPAVALIRDGHVLSNVKNTNLDLSPGAGVAVILLFNGRLHVINLSSASIISPAAWLDVKAFKLNFLHPLTAGINAPKMAFVHYEQSISGIVGSGELDSSVKQQTLQQLNNLSQNPPPPSERRVESAASALFKAFVGALKSKKAAYDGFPGYSEHPPARSFWSRLKDTFADRIMTSKLAPIIGRGQARYLQDMLDKFSGNDLIDALKYAIPLNDINAAIESQRRSLSMGRLEPRQDLSIRPYSASSGSIINLQEEFLRHLRATYERSFVKLDAAQKYEEAAFVLAELLRDINRAVSYLEQHGRFVMAAQLAEGQKLPPARIIRQWVVAGDFERAKQIAILSGCYEEAITLLERSNHAHAEELRWHCAQLHYAAGDIKLAAKIAWPIESRRDQVLEWMRCQAQLGGQIGAEQLVLLWAEDSANSQLYARQIYAILEDHSSSNVSVRLSLLQAACNLDSECVKSISTLACRSYLIDISLGQILYDPKLWDKINSLSGNQVLRADTRNLKLAQVNPPVRLENVATSSFITMISGLGRLILDCTVLQSGEALIALGEAGAELWSVAGKKLKSFGVPCHKLIPADNGNRVILLALRGNIQALHIYDHPTGRIEFWCDANFTQWASSFDGIKWIVAKGQSVWVLNVNAQDGQNAIWSVSDLPGDVLSINRSIKHFSMALACAQGVEIWTYNLPNLYLQERNPLHRKYFPAIRPLAFSPSGMILASNPIDPKVVAIFTQLEHIAWDECTILLNASGLSFSDEFLAQWSTEADGVILVKLYRVKRLALDKQLLEVKIVGAKVVNFRWLQGFLLLFTDTGDIGVFDLQWRDKYNIYHVS